MNSISTITRFSIVSVLIAFATCLASNSSNAFGQDLKWETDLEHAIQLAEKEKKLVLLHFAATWSKPCQDLQSFVYSSPQVQRAIHANVIPVQIDVDEQVELTSQYGIGKVPYDIVITPSKRIIVRRESPKESVAYSLMIGRLEKSIQQMAQQGTSTIDQNLDDFQALMQKSAPIVQHESITPKGPSHQGAAASQDSEELNRKFVTNPAYQRKQISEAAQQTADKPQASLDSPKANVPAAPGRLKIINPNFIAGNDAGSVRPATMQPNLQRPPVSSSASVNDSRPKPIDKAAFVGNPTAAATEFKADLVAKNEPEAVATIDSPNISQPGSLPAKQPLSNSPIGSSAAALVPLASSKSASESFLPAKEGIAKEGIASIQRPEKQVENLLAEKDQPSIPAGLQGKCPVTLIREGRWVAGDNRWGCVHRDRTYLFESQEKLSTFLADPDAYSPLLAGFDPVVFERTGKLVPGLEEHGVFMGKAPNLRVVLFSDKDTRKEFEANPKMYVLTIREAMEKSGGGSSPVEN